MARRRYLVAYDIADPKRLRKVCSIMETFGHRLQYSVFVCDLSPGEVGELQVRVLEVMSLEEDSVVRIDLGPQRASAPIVFVGRRRPVPGDAPLIV